MELRAKILKAIEKESGVKKAEGVPHWKWVPSARTKCSRCLSTSPDLNWDDNKLTIKSTQMLYESYNSEHYQELLFSDSGYTGPNGENLISMRQYYQERVRRQLQCGRSGRRLVSSF
ncbi:immune inhibitor A [Vibrio chagasii]|nr:immune inhibitor A [Vibrio chagasii]